MADVRAYKPPLTDFFKGLRDEARRRAVERQGNIILPTTGDIRNQNNYPLTADRAKQIASQAMMNTPGLIAQANAQKGAGVPGQDYNRPVSLQAMMNTPGLVAQSASQTPASFGEEAINKGAQAGLLTSNIDTVTDRFKNAANQSSDIYLQNRNEQKSGPMSFIDRISKRALESLGQPAQFGGNFVTEQARGELALQANEAVTAKAQQEAALKAAEIAEKNAPKQGKLTSEVNNLYSKVQGAVRRVDAANQIKEILSSSGSATGSVGAAKTALVSIAAAFNINLGKTEEQDVKFLLAKLKRQMIASRIFGRETNKQEQELIDKLLPGPGFLTNIDMIAEAADSEIRSAQQDAKDASGLLENFGYNLPSQFKNKKYIYKQD